MRYINEKLEDGLKAFQDLAKKKGINLSIKGNSLTIPKGKEDEFSKVFDDILDDFHKKNDFDISWDQDNDGDIEVSEKSKKKESVSITLEKPCLIEGKIYEKNTTFFVKDSKDSEEDILLEKDIRVNDVILTKGEVLSSNVLEERSFYINPKAVDMIKDDIIDMIQIYGSALKVGEKIGEVLNTIIAELHEGQTFDKPNAISQLKNGIRLTL